jgi:hypothetical protein
VPKRDIATCHNPRYANDPRALPEPESVLAVN